MSVCLSVCMPVFFFYLSQSLSLSLTLSLSISHYFSLILSLSISLSYSLFLQSLSLLLCLFQSLFLSYTVPFTLSLSLSHTHTHTHSLLPSVMGQGKSKLLLHLLRSLSSHPAGFLHFFRALTALPVSNPPPGAVCLHYHHLKQFLLSQMGWCLGTHCNFRIQMPTYPV
jgi:hypothetical protein